MLGIFVFATFILGLVHLMMLRFSSGDVYPYYSSFRADPLGTKALYESLKSCCDFQVERNHEPFSRVMNRFDSTVLVVGLEHHLLATVPKNVGEEINYFVGNGGRLVVALYRPPREKVALNVLRDDKESIDLTDVWGVRLFEEGLVRGGAYLSPEYASKGLPARISSHTPLYFQLVSPGWITVYKRGQLPVIVERKLGRGSLVLSAESYFLSNQAMVKERQTGLLSWLIGNPEVVIFDEYHHGIAVDAGVMYLARRYDLEWFLILLAVLALLFIWKNATPFVPPEKESVESMQRGKESVAALTNLLRRNVSEAHVLPASVSEWRKSAKGIAPEQIKAMEAIVSAEMAKPSRQRNLADAYNSISRMLKQRR